MTKARCIHGAPWYRDDCPKCLEILDPHKCELDLSLWQWWEKLRLEEVAKGVPEGSITGVRDGELPSSNNKPNAG